MAALSTGRDTHSRYRHGFLQVADLASQAGVTPATVRYYARIGLLNPARNHNNGYRCFNHDDLRRVMFVRKAQSLGLTISDIRNILERLDHGDPVCDLVVDVVQQRLEGVRRQSAELEALRTRIEHALEQWSDDPPDPTSDLCPLIEQVEDCGAVAAEERAKMRFNAHNGSQHGPSTTAASA